MAIHRPNDIDLVGLPASPGTDIQLYADLLNGHKSPRPHTLAWASMQLMWR